MRFWGYYSSEPRVGISLAAVGVLIGVSAAIASGQVHGKGWVGRGLIVLGTAMLMRQAWSKKTTWTDLKSSKQCWIGVALIVAANVLDNL